MSGSNWWWFQGGGHVDPSSIPLTTLAKIRGCMWPVRLNLPYGPRPGQDDNILPMDMYQLYSPSDRKRMLERYVGDGYTHAVTGPLWGTDCYHNQFPCHDASNPGSFPSSGPPSQSQWDSYLDRLQEWWDVGITPIFFVDGDGNGFESTRDTWTPFLTQPRAQRLIRILLPAGWEAAGYERSSYTWAMFFQWGREVMPNALILHHNPCKPDGSPYDAPVGTDANGDDTTNPHGNGDGWARVTPYLHGWLVQNGPFNVSPDQDPTLAYNFGGQFSVGADGAATHGFAWHFANGVNGWPTGSAWGANIPLKLYNGECTSYEAYWNNLPYPISQAWGNLAMRSGAAGYLDGGTVEVP